MVFRSIDDLPAVERAMRRIRLLLLLVVVLFGVADRLVAQEKVEVRGITSVIKLDELLFGHLNELNGKFKIRDAKSRKQHYFELPAKTIAYFFSK